MDAILKALCLPNRHYIHFFTTAWDNFLIEKFLSIFFIHTIMEKKLEKAIMQYYDPEQFFKESDTYKKVLEHRKHCQYWGKTFCIDCFGGGLTKFTENLIAEKRRKKVVEVF